MSLAPPTERLPIQEFTAKAYLDYSMYVILDRALPNVADGLKPVQRRIVYAMAELGLAASAKHKKSARTVGDVLGKYHPHGDSACYEAMVLMAQPFSYRYPLIDGQGNWGSPDDPKSFAAMRYTEARLTPYAQTLLAELEQGTVDWQGNFDGTLEEPTLLPARLPNLLLNGTTGIAVGMATDIPPHNLRETVAACVYLLDHPDAGVAELCAHLPAPDFPTTAEIITPKAELLSLYATGNGSLRARARFEVEDGAVIVTALPYQVSGARIMEQIASQMQAKKLPMVEDLRDESDHEHPTRLVIVPRGRKADIEPLMSHLFATTDLEKSYRVNFNVIGLDGKPRVRSLVELLGEWLEFRRRTVTRRLEHRLERVLARLHILDGLFIAYLNIDEVIAIIRHEEEPGPALMARFALSELQTEAILELKLRHIARLEEMKIRGEQATLTEERQALQDTLASPKRLKALIKDELRQDAARHGDERRSPLIERTAPQALDDTERVSSEPITVILSTKGWVRAAKGHDVDVQGLSYRTGDDFLAAARCRNNQSVHFLDSTGRSYTVAAHELPSARGLGEPLTGRLTPAVGAGFRCVLAGAEEDDLLLASSHGYGFRTRLGALTARNRAGKAVLTLAEGAAPLEPLCGPDLTNGRLALATARGRLLVFAVREMPELERGKGNKLIELGARELREGLDRVIAWAWIGEGNGLRIYAASRSLNLKPADLERFTGSRARRGQPLPNAVARVTRLEAV